MRPPTLPGTLDPFLSASPHRTQSGCPQPIVTFVSTASKPFRPRTTTFPKHRSVAELLCNKWASDAPFVLTDRWGTEPLQPCRIQRLWLASTSPSSAGNASIWWYAKMCQSNTRMPWGICRAGICGSQQLDSTGVIRPRLWGWWIRRMAFALREIQVFPKIGLQMKL
jgi:hypothetical protein